MDLGEDEGRWFNPDGYQSVAQAVLDSIYSTDNTAEAAYGAALILAEHGLNTRDEIQAALTDPQAQEASPVKAAWGQLPGQRSLLTWTYFLMLCGVPGVKADRMIVAYVSKAIGRPVDPREASALVRELADELGISHTKLDHAIWRKESGREVYVDNEGGANG